MSSDGIERTTEWSMEIVGHDVDPIEVSSKVGPFIVLEVSIVCCGSNTNLVRLSIFSTLSIKEFSQLSDNSRVVLLVLWSMMVGGETTFDWVFPIDVDTIEVVLDSEFNSRLTESLS